MVHKILVSRGYGAGWSSWFSGNDEAEKFMLTYQPIIDFLEAGNKFSYDDSHNEEHPLLLQLQSDMKEKFDVDYVCVLGAHGLAVEEVSGPFFIDEYDGAESVNVPDDYGWIDFNSSK